MTGFDPNIPNAARIYDFMLGGKDNFAADRAAAEVIIAAYPEACEAIRLNRSSLGRAVEYLAKGAGVRQFLDIGSGLPTQKNVDEIARGVAPKSRVVYVDNDPVVRLHGEALLADAPGVVVVEADLRDPKTILTRAAEVIDFREPVALLLVAILHFIPDEDDPYIHVARLCDALAPGSYLIISHMVYTEERRDDIEKLKEIYGRAGCGLYPRTRQEIRGFFGGFTMLDLERFVDPRLLSRVNAAGWAGVGRKP